jgi:hypothetical protein
MTACGPCSIVRIPTAATSFTIERCSRSPATTATCGRPARHAGPRPRARSSVRSATSARERRSTAASHLLNVDLYPSVLRLSHAGPCLHQRPARPKALNPQDFTWNTVLDRASPARIAVCLARLAAMSSVTSSARLVSLKCGLVQR